MPLSEHLPTALRGVAARLPGALAPPVEDGTPTPTIVIIGSGFGGLGMAIRLKQAGIHTFTIHEKADSVGGTWRDNTYPGAACDVPSHLYSLSFAPKADWTRRFPEQSEILDYLNEVVDRFDLGSHLRFGSELAEASWDDDARSWDLRFADGTIDAAQVLIAATGQLNRPHVPRIDGSDAFAGNAFHSARWDHEVDLADKDVAVIGIGASAIQFVPQVAASARSVTLYQRSSNYVAPKPDGEYTERQRARFERHPLLQRAYRFSIWARFEVRFTWFRRGSRVGRLVEGRFKSELAKLVSDDLTQQALIPDYTFGCKRVLIANDWYPTLLQPHVHVVTDRVERIEPEGVVAGGELRRAEVLIYGTGFESTGFLAPIHVVGRAGRDLREAWADGARAHLGVTVAGFPNLFLLYGPNTNLGHNSIVFMLERQISYILTTVRRMVEDGIGSVEVRSDVQEASNDRLQRRLRRTVWADSCHSWYKTAAGRITNNWSGLTLDYWRRTARPRWQDFRLEPRSTTAEAHSGAERVRH